MSNILLHSKQQIEWRIIENSRLRALEERLGVMYRNINNLRVLLCQTTFVSAKFVVHKRLGTICRVEDSYALKFLV